MSKQATVIPTSDAIHEMFGLAYASYLVLPRVLLQSMPVRWQRRFVKMVRELETAFQHVERPQDYWVRTREGNRFVPETLPPYRHGYVEPRKAVRP